MKTPKQLLSFIFKVLTLGLFYIVFHYFGLILYLINQGFGGMEESVKYLKNLDFKKLWIASIHWNWAGCEFNEEIKNHLCSGFDMGQKLNTDDPAHGNYVIMSTLPNTIFIACILLFYKPLSKKVSLVIYQVLDLDLANTKFLFTYLFQMHNLLDKYVRFPSLIDAGVWLIFAMLYFLILILAFYLYLNLSTYATSSLSYGSLKQSWEAYQKLGFWAFLPKLSRHYWYWFHLDILHLDYFTYCMVPNLAIVVLTLTLIKGCFFTEKDD